MIKTMDYEETDLFFIQTLKNILSDVKECKAYVKDLHTPEYDEINADYDEQISDLEDLLKTIKTIDDLAELSEERITAVYDYLADFADNFIISADPVQKEKDLQEYEKLEGLLNLFLDTDEDDYEE